MTFLKTGVILACFQSNGTLPSVKNLLNEINCCLIIQCVTSFKVLGVILSDGALTAFIFLIVCNTLLPALRIP